MNRSSPLVWILWAPVAVSTLALGWIVPPVSAAAVADPSYWGILGYGATLALLVRAYRKAGSRFPTALFAIFLAVMPLVYVANWLRAGGSSGWLVVELAGLVGFGAVAWWGWSRAAGWLPVGIAAHGVWDAWHLQAVGYVPVWYATACALVDVAVGGLAAGWYLLVSRAAAQAPNRREGG